MDSYEALRCAVREYAHKGLNRDEMIKLIVQSEHYKHPMNHEGKRYGIRTSMEVRNSIYQFIAGFCEGLALAKEIE